MTRGRRPIAILAILALILPLAACSGLSSKNQRTLSGAGIGAAGGAAIGLLAGGSVVAATLVGGAAGAAIGAFSDEDQVKVKP
ncbi:hypothetical protein [Shumkonia mesophila]|uniref:hypothetical protein n=1 Tax=Shumkonia mesophila TaxID=2838854 RepID=UPI002934D5CD|nr:hypothetical protein [Shumkonia mesophila]